MNKQMNESIKSLLTFINPKKIIYDDENLKKYSEDMTENEPHLPDVIVKPTEVDEIVKIIKLANEQKIPITPRAAGTNLGGLTIPIQGGIVLDLSDMNKIIEINETEMYALIEPGVTFGDIRKYLDERHPGLKFGYPLSPPYTSIVCNCLLDGLANLSNKHGTMSEWINGIEAILPNGEIMKCGSCAISPYWFANTPFPDLLGLFINWQGTTGIVTKMAVQLWPNPPLRERMFLMSYDIDTTYSIIKKFTRTGLFDDIGGLSWPSGKMLLGIKRPKQRDPNEPEFFVYLDISGAELNEIELKSDYIKSTIVDIKKLGKDIDGPFDINVLIKINPNFAKFAEFPTTLDFLLEHGGGGLTWIGTYGPTDRWEEGIKEGFEIMNKYGFPPTAVTRPMKGGHFAVLRFIMIFDKSDKDEIERIKLTQKALCEMVIEKGFIPYKTPAWVMKLIEHKIDKNYLNTIKLIKSTFDPNKIMNPGRLLF